MVKLCECVRECSFEKPYEVVNFLFLTHNQNTHVHEELLKSMKDLDALNDILGYACLVEGTQHSESLSKAYLDTVKIPNSSVKLMQLYKRKTITTISFMANVRVQNIDHKVKEVTIVITVVTVTLQNVRYCNRICQLIIYCFGCIVDFVVLLIYSVCVDRSGSLSGGAFNQLRLATLNIVLTILY